MKRTKITFVKDGQNNTSGLVDSLRGMISIYHFCKTHNIKYEIKFTYPYSLSSYLRPNKYDWIPIEDKNIDELEHTYIDLFCSGKANEIIEHRTFLENLITNYYGKHIYIRTNTLCFTDNFSEDFKELFVPSLHLKHIIETHLRLFTNGFNSISCRTCGIFGDFPDMLSPLTHERQYVLIDKYKDTITRLASESASESKKLLVTSDSLHLISILSDIHNTVIIPGPIVHSRNSLNKDGIDKVFTDFFLISNADKVYSITSDGLFQGAFSYFAAKLGDKEYTTVQLSNS